MASSVSVKRLSSLVNPKQPRPFLALHLKPLRHEAEFGIPSCDLQLRSFSQQPLEVFSDFALRAAYYLGLPTSGPIPLPRIKERWTVPKSHFIFKKSQENFERVTLRRMIRVKDGEPEIIQLWLAYLLKNQCYGVGMKAQVWEFSEIGRSESVSCSGKKLGGLDSIWPSLGQTTTMPTDLKVSDLLYGRQIKEAPDLGQASLSSLL